MSHGSLAQYVISSEWAKQKAQLLIELAGGNGALKYSHALDAVAIGCGFPDWQILQNIIVRLEAGAAHELDITPMMLADDLHVDDATHVARLRNQLKAIKKYIACTPSKASTLVKLWALSDYSQPHGEVDLDAPRARAFPANLESDVSGPASDIEYSFGAPTMPGATSEGTGVSGASADTLPTAASRPEGEAPAAPSALAVAVTYRKRRTVEPR
jgi:hypothetical protein